MALDSQSAAGPNIDSQDCNLSTLEKSTHLATSDDAFTKDGEAHAPTKETTSASSVLSIRSRSTPGRYPRSKSLKHKPKSYNSVAHTVKENEKIRKSVIADYLERRRSIQESKVAQLITGGFPFGPNDLRRHSFVEQKSPNVFRKSFLEQSNQLYPKALPTDIRKIFAANQLSIGTTGIRWQLGDQGDKDDSDGVTTSKPQRNKLGTPKRQLDMLDGLELRFGSDITDGDDTSHIIPEELIQENEQFLQKLNKQMAGTPLKVSSKAYVKLKENGSCTVPEMKERFPWLMNK